MTTIAAFTLEVKENGRVFLPVAFRRSMGIKPGERLIAHVSETGKAELITAGHVINAARGMYAHLVTGGESLADELVAERHREAQRE